MDKIRKPYGLTGNIGCGKSTIANILRANEVAVYDCDSIARGIVASPEHRQRIVEILGTDAPFAGEAMDRKMVAKIIFSNPEIKDELEKYVHPLMWGEIEWDMQFLPEATIVFVEAAILYETGSASKCEAVLVATCSEGEQIRRLRSARNMSIEGINARINAQIPQSEKEARADMVISTELPLKQLEQEIGELCERLRKVNQQGEVK